MVDQYVPALKSMRAIAFDIGDRNPFVGTNRQLADALARLDVPHTFDVYEGDHGNRIRERFEFVEGRSPRLPAGGSCS
jgi:hypothetical protein